MEVSEMFILLKTYNCTVHTRVFSRPDFMQMFASKKVYMFFYGLIGIVNVSNLYFLTINYI